MNEFCNHSVCGEFLQISDFLFLIGHLSWDLPNTHGLCLTSNCIVKLEQCTTPSWNLLTEPNQRFSSPSLYLSSSISQSNCAKCFIDASMGCWWWSEPRYKPNRLMCVPLTYEWRRNPPPPLSFLQLRKHSRSYEGLISEDALTSRHSIYPCQHSKHNSPSPKRRRQN